MKEIPILFGKPSDKALFHPQHYLKHAKVNQKIDIAVIYFSSKIDKQLNKKFGKKINKQYLRKPFFKITKINKKNIAFIYSDVGGASSGANLEELIALGAKKAIIVGSCGTLKNIPLSSLIVPNRAIRDEGTSYHYLRPNKFVYPSKNILRIIKETTKEANIKTNIGTTWTTDAPYRETFRKIKKYIKEDTISVEMEAASLFAIAKYRKIQIGAIFWVSDQLLKKWEPGFETKEYKNGAKNAFEILIKTIVKITK